MRMRLRSSAMGVVMSVTELSVSTNEKLAYEMDISLLDHTLYTNTRSGVMRSKLESACIMAWDDCMGSYGYDDSNTTGVTEGYRRLRPQYTPKSLMWEQSFFFVVRVDMSYVSWEVS